MLPQAAEVLAGIPPIVGDHHFCQFLSGHGAFRVLCRMSCVYFAGK